MVVVVVVVLVAVAVVVLIFLVTKVLSCYAVILLMIRKIIIARNNLIHLCGDMMFIL